MSEHAPESVNETPQPAVRAVVLSRPTRSLLLVAIVVTVAALRLYYCALLPAHTTDTIHSIYYGLAVNKHGLAAAATPLIRISPGFEKELWHDRPFHYPVLAPAFFALVTMIWPSLFFAKFCLTLCEAANARMVARYTGNRWLGIVYWASPISIWWVSHEGQFESLQSLFMFAGLLLLKRRRYASAFALLAFAAQVKVFAIFLLPFFVDRTMRQDRPQLKRALVGFAIGCLPTLATLPILPTIQLVIRNSAVLTYNPYYWDLWATNVWYRWPHALSWINQASTYALLVVLLVAAFRYRSPGTYAPALLHLILCKVHINVLYWYMLPLLGFLVIIEQPVLRATLMVLHPLLNTIALGHILLGPIGSAVAPYYAGLGITSAMQNIQLL